MPIRWLFALRLAALSLPRPHAARSVLAFFMPITAGVNVDVGVTDPGAHLTFGTSSPLPLHVWFFHRPGGLRACPRRVRGGGGAWPCWGGP